MTDSAGFGSYPLPAARTGQLGMVVFLASDVMLFAAFFATYFLLRTQDSPWPPAGVRLGTGRAALFTLALVSSSATMIRAERAETIADRVRTRRWLLATVVLGTVFLANQLIEYAQLDFRPSTHAYGSIYWLLTGLHAAHVAVGLLALLAVYVRVVRAPRLGQVTPWLRGVSMYWHVVDVIWVCVFLTIWVVR